MICRICGEEFTPTRKHPGFINVCLEEDCRVSARESQVKPMQEMSEARQAGS
jgi:hypothetical protein